MKQSMAGGAVSGAAVLVLGVGNSMKGDDGVGPYVAARLGLAGSARCGGAAAAGSLISLDCGTTPENYTSVVRQLRPRTLLIVDAAEMGLEPGECRIIAPERVGGLGLSTHSMPLSLFMNYVQDLAGQVVLIGVQPRGMAVGGLMSPEVTAAGEMLAELIARGLWKTIVRLA